MNRTFRTYKNSLDTQMVLCDTCNHKKISPLNPKWIFPCRITYHCSKCQNIGDVYYSPDCVLAEDIRRLRASRGIC